MSTGISSASTTYEIGRTDIAEPHRRTLLHSYVIAQQSLALQLTKAQKANTELRARLATEGRPQKVDPWDIQGGEKGTGLDLLEDKYNSSSGQH